MDTQTSAINKQETEAVSDSEIKISSTVDFCLPENETRWNSVLFYIGRNLKSFYFSKTEQKCCRVHRSFQGPHCWVWARGKTGMNVIFQIVKWNTSEIIVLDAVSHQLSCCVWLQLSKFKNMIPFDQMTIEDLNATFPETKLDKVKYPYWPHKPIADL